MRLRTVAAVVVGAVVGVAVNVAANQVLNSGRWNLWWLFPAVVLAVLAGILSLWLSTRGNDHSEEFKGQSQSASLTKIADKLAGEVSLQWRAEADRRGLNDPYPLPVRWTPEPSLSGDWDGMRTLASTGAGWPARSPDTWATDPGSLAGNGNGLVDVLERVPTRRLVVLGEPGAGKTMQMIRLVLDILSRRPNGGPVPLLCPIASWNPSGKSLRVWLEDMLPEDHPTLKAAPPPSAGNGTWLHVLLEAGLILPILDGLDEIPLEVRAQAIDKINLALKSGAAMVVKPGEPIVVTCRTQEYGVAVMPRYGPGTGIKAAAAVRLEPLKAADVSRYLKAAISGVEQWWNPVVNALGPGSAVGQALESPLMLALACATYDVRPDDPSGELPVPSELCGPEFADRAAVEQHLFDAFVRVAYRADTSVRWTAQDAERWLGFLARHLQFTIGHPDFAWWELPGSAPKAITSLTGRVRKGLVLGDFFGVVFGLAATLVVGFVIASARGLGAGVLAGLAAGLVIWLADGAMSPLPGRLGTWLTAGLVIGLVTGLAGGLVGSAVGGTVAGLAAGLVFGVATRLAAKYPLGTTTRFWSALGLLFAAWFTAWLVAGMTAGPMAGGIVALVGAALVTGHLRYGERTDTAWPALIIGLTGGLVAGVVAGVVAGIAPGLMAGIAVCIIVGTRNMGLVLNYWGLGLLPGYSDAAMSPSTNLALNRRVALVQCCGVGLGIALVFGAVIGAEAGIAAGLVAATVGGTVAGLTCGRMEPRWPSYLIARAWLALRNQLPWRLMKFLADAHQRGILRQAGAVYQFRHIDLQRRLATRILLPSPK